VNEVWVFSDFLASQKLEGRKMSQLVNMRNLRGGISLLALVISIAIIFGCILWAQQPNTVEPLQVLHEKEVEWTKADPANFTGDVAMQGLPITKANMRVSRVRFQSGAHTNWHMHEGGQVLYVEAGRVRAQKWGGEIQEFGPGDVVYIAAGEKHWHGAAPQTGATHIAVSIGTSNWKERVTEQEYLKKR
jgi:quercetin dioxygenase-like cupin family protein